MDSVPPFVAIDCRHVWMGMLQSLPVSWDVIFLTVSLMDRLTKKIPLFSETSRRFLLACLFIAEKFHYANRHIPSTLLLEISNRYVDFTVSKKTLLDLEVWVLNTLGFEMMCNNEVDYIMYCVSKGLNEIGNEECVEEFAEKVLDIYRVYLFSYSSTDFPFTKVIDHILENLLIPTSSEFEKVTEIDEKVFNCLT